MQAAKAQAKQAADKARKAAEAASIFTAMQEQLGLKLTPAKANGAFFVVDNVERPSGN